jgi:hypothetical protein
MLAAGVQLRALRVCVLVSYLVLTDLYDPLLLVGCGTAHLDSGSSEGKPSSQGTSSECAGNQYLQQAVQTGLTVFGISLDNVDGDSGEDCVSARQGHRGCSPVCEAAHQLLCSHQARLGLGFFPTFRSVKARPDTCIRSAMFGCGIGMRKCGLEGAGCSTC